MFDHWYASQLCDPHQKVLIESLERVQKFGLCMSCKQWRSDYESLLVWADLPSLKTCRSISKLCYFNKMLCGVMHSFILLSKPRIMDSKLLSFQDSMLLQPFARTDSCKFSFYPDSIAPWNHLPPWVCNSPNLSVFKNNLCIFSADVFLCFHLSLYHLLFFFVGSALNLAFDYCQSHAASC